MWDIGTLVLGGQCGLSRDGVLVPGMLMQSFDAAVSTNELLGVGWLLPGLGTVRFVLAEAPRRFVLLRHLGRFRFQMSI
jgi:hypothetical protein